jgi:hypothetical protein
VIDEERPVLTRVNAEGVLLKYYARKLQNLDPPRATDRERMILKNAERELRILEIIIEALEPSSIGSERAIEAIRRIEVALAVLKDKIGE